jgi:SAM-dependent methyltransferase
LAALESFLPHQDYFCVSVRIAQSRFCGNLAGEINFMSDNLPHKTSLENEAPRFLCPPELLPLLRCPACKGSLTSAESGLSCPACGRLFPEVRGILRFVDQGNYADSFGYQWKSFQRTQLDQAHKSFSEPDFIRKTGLTQQDMNGKLVLDVGCGMGRFAEVVTRWGARVVGIDFSAAAEVAAKNLADRQFVALQADVFSLPFAPETFDCIYSMGVLHHTPDCERAVKILPQYLKSGGTLAVWLYSGYNKWYRFSDQYRKITQRMSPRALHRFFRVAVPFFYWLDRGLRRVPIVGKPVAGVIHHVFPVNRNPDAEMRVLDTLDWYSPQYQSKHTYEQVFRWFESCGLEDLTVGDVAVGVRGRKPL